MATVNGIPFEGGMDSPTGTGAQHIVQTCEAICSWLVDGSTPGQMLDSYPGGLLSLDWVNRNAYATDGSTIVIDWVNLQLLDASPSLSVDWNLRKLFDDGGTEIIDWNGEVQTQNVPHGFFGHATANQQTGGAATAGVLYSATEQGMINRMYTALRNYGLIT